jgi:hypothetical protein
MKTTLPMSAARRAWQITSAVQKRRNHDQLLPSRQFFRSLLAFCLSIIFSENRFPLFGIML